MNRLLIIVLGAALGGAGAWVAQRATAAERTAQPIARTPTSSALSSSTAAPNASDKPTASPDPQMVVTAENPDPTMVITPSNPDPQMAVRPPWPGNPAPELREEQN